MRFAFLVPVLCLLAGVAQAQGDPEVRVTVLPEQPLIERTRLGEALNMDFLVENRSAVALEVVRVKIAVRDSRGRIVQRVEINENGVAPGIETLANRRIAAGATNILFNPLHTFPAGTPLDRLEIELVLADPDGRLRSVHTRAAPRHYQAATRLTLPLGGRVLVWDGHDYYAHHRRLDYLHPALRELGWRVNSSRYSLDLVVVDTDGEMRGAGEGDAAYHGYRAPVLAPGDGRVVAAVGDVAEGAAPDLAALRDPGVVLGNRIVIDHGNGEYSHLGHLLPGSLRVRVGDVVRSGQQIAQLGNSGWSLFPHLHYELTRSGGPLSEGLPAAFGGFDRVIGVRTERVRQGPIDSGDIVTSRAGGRAYTRR